MIEFNPFKMFSTLTLSAYPCNIQSLEYPVTTYSTSHIKVVLDPDDLRWETFLNQADIPSPAIFLNRQLPSNGNEYVAKKFVPSF